MKIGLMGGFAPPFDVEVVEAVGAEGERHGFESVWNGEHALWFESYRRPYPHSETGRLPIESGLLEPLTAFAFLAARTTTLRLATGVLLVPQRNPIYTAQQVATLDVLSKGRVILGVGLGWQAEEYEALRVPWEGRGRRLDEYLQVMRELWTTELSSFAGEFCAFEPSRQFPKPAQRPHPPIHVGGNSDAALRRAARDGQGWYGIGLSPEQVAERVDRLAGLLAEYGRSRTELEVTVPYRGPRVDVAAGLAAYRDAGVDRLLFRFDASSPQAVRGSLAELAATLWPDRVP